MLEKIISELSPGNELSPDDVLTLDNRFKEKATRALEAVQKKAVQLITFKPSERELWGVTGQEKTHLVLRHTYCDCVDFYMNVVIKRKNECCYHLIAVEIANKLKIYNHISANDEEYGKVRNKFK